MPNVTPAALFTGYELLAATDPAPAEGIFIPLTAFSGGGGELTAANADPSTGDGRKVVYEFVETVNRKIAALDAASKPRFMTISRSETRGNAADSITRSITLKFEEQILTTQLQAEPS